MSEPLEHWYMKFMLDNPKATLGQQLRAAYKLGLEEAAILGHKVAFEYLGMGTTQHVYSWHEVEDALTKATNSIRALAAPSPSTGTKETK